MAAPVITPNTVLLRGNERQTFVADQPVVWTCRHGYIDSLGNYEAPNVYGVYTVKATNGVNESSVASITVNSELKFVPSVGSGNCKLSKKFFVSESETLSRDAVYKGDAIVSIEQEFTSRSLEEFLELNQFWEDHYPDKPFYYFEPVLEKESLFYFDGGLSHTQGSYNNINYKFGMIEIQPFIAQNSNMPNNMFPFEPHYGWERSGRIGYVSWDAPSYGRISRRLTKSVYGYNLQFKNRSPLEIQDVINYWNNYFPNKAFTFRDTSLGIEGQFVFDSELSWNYISTNEVDYGFSIAEFVDNRVQVSSSGTFPEASETQQGLITQSGLLVKANGSVVTVQ